MTGLIHLRIQISGPLGGSAEIHGVREGEHLLFKLLEGGGKIRTGGVENRDQLVHTKRGNSWS